VGNNRRIGSLRPWLALAVLVVLGTLHFVSFPQINLLRNPGFEEGVEAPEGWSPWPAPRA